MSCVLDGEIVCLAPDGRSQFYDLLFRRQWPYFIAFDALMINGEDLRDRPLLERKRRLRAIMPAAATQARILYHDHIDGRGVALFDAVRGNDLEGIVASGSTSGTTRTGRPRRGSRFGIRSTRRSKAAGTCSRHGDLRGAGRGRLGRSSVPN
jgi:bifunctional non-homologous end joining protein LigD